MAPSASDALTTAFDAQSIGELQSQLRAMSYNEPVGIDSAPLVHHLLTDLIKASEARQLDNLKTEKAQRDVNELSQILLTLREENARLTKENNSLHLEKIHQEEAIAEREQACEVQLEGLRDDIKKLQLLYSQKSQQCTHKEKELAKLQEQLTLGKAIAPHSSVSMGKQTLKQLHLDDEQVTEVQQSQQQAQESIEQQDQLTQLTKENEKLRFQCHQFNEKLAKREQEIERLLKLAVQDFKETDSSLKEMKSLEDRDQMESQQEKMELQVAQLSTQVNTLKDQVIMYEGRLQEATEQNSWQDDLAEKLKDAELDREHLLNELNMRQANHHVLEEEYLRCENEHRERENLSISESPNVETNKCKKQDHETNLDSLKEQVNMLSTHKDRLEDALRSMHYDKIAYTNALLNADSQNGALTSDLAHAEAKLEELHKVKAKLEESLSDAQSSLITHTRKLDVLRESLKQSEDKCALGNEKNTSLHQDLRSMDQLLSHRDDELRYLNHELLVQKEELERLYNRLDGLEAAIEDVESDDEALVGRNALFAREIKWLEEERHNLCREKEELMLQVMKLEEELRKAKTSSEEAEHNCKKYLEKINMASTMQTNLESKLKTKKRECLDMQRQLVESTEKSRELADKQQQAKILLHRAEETENERTVIQNEALALKRHVEELRDQNACLKNRVDNDEIYAKRLMDQSQKLQSDFTLASKKCSTLEKEKEDLQHKYDDAMADLRTARQTWHHYQNEFEKLTQEVQAQQHSLSSGQDALQSSQSSISELRNQVRQLQSESKLRQSNFQQLETRLEQEKLSHKSVQAQVLLLQDELLQVKETNRAREIALKQLREDIQSKDRDLTEKTEALENFKLLIEQMESSRDQMVFQMKQRQQQIQRHQQESDDLNAKIGSLESDVLAKNSENSTLKKLTRALDSEKDAVNDQLDALTEKYHEMEEQNNELRKTLQSKISDATGMQEQLTNCVNKLNEVEDKASHLQEHCSELESQVGHLEQMKGVHTAELAALAQDLENMTVENQAISEECTRLQHSEHSRFQSTKNMKQTIRGIERERDTLQIELDDLRHTY
ncbi:hypothetical protein CCR75_006785 [Bremia lactucae]|uniref:Uncharacterized protein n=1 Tax=Bremia lactucae TaxID=4779 RepID=A0A976FJ88_BRELC|nr:hypothetical protein CCR75_006785 [Bremia lactucae]